MEEVKLNKLVPTFDKYAGRQASFSVEHKEYKVHVNGLLQKNDKQYWFTNGAGKVIIEKKTSGSMMTLKGTYHVFSVKFMVGDMMMAEFEIPTKGTFRFGVSD
ncbi:MAG: hypothetical protein RBT80_11515 [Candidatus Vecturithrix sp.]|jgi:hypothetical protein|nr:hypothetical protein [Candidatus Vecturithrix sp.]